MGGALRSGVFSLGGATYKVIVGIIGMVIFSRLIPDEYHGVFAIIMAINIIVLPLLDLGLLPAYLKIDNVNKEVNSVFFSLNIGIGVILTIVLLVFAPIYAKMEDLNELKYYLWAYAGLIFITSFGSQPSAQLIKQNRFKEIAVIDIVASSIALIVGIGLALMHFKVWALLIRFIVDVIIKTILQFLRVNPSYDVVNISTIKKYSKNIIFGIELTANRFIAGLTNSTDKFLMKSFFGIGDGIEKFGTVGQYDKAVSATAKADMIRNALTTPALSHLTALNSDSAREHYFDLAQLFFFVTALPVLYFVVYGDLVARILFGTEWHQAEIFARFLGFYGAGLTLKGLVNIFHINELVSKRLYQIHLLFFFLLYAILIGLYFFFDISSFAFVRWLSLITFVFWLYFLIFSLYSFTKKFKKAMTSLRNIFVMTLVFIITGLTLRYLASGLGFSGLIFQVIVAAFIALISYSMVIVAIRLVDKRGFEYQYNLIYSRIKNWRQSSRD